MVTSHGPHPAHREARKGTGASTGGATLYYLKTFLHKNVRSYVFVQKRFLSYNNRIDLSLNKINKRNEAVLSEKPEKQGGLPRGKPTSFYCFAAKTANCSVNPYLGTGLMAQFRFGEIRWASSVA